MSYRWFESMAKGEFVRDPRTAVNQGLKWLENELSHNDPPIKLSDVYFVLCEVKMFWSNTGQVVSKAEIIDLLRKDECVHIQVVVAKTHPSYKIGQQVEWLEFESKKKHDVDEEWMSNELQRQVDDHVRRTGQENACIWRGDGKKYLPSPDALAEGIAAKKEREAAKRKSQAERRKRARLKKKALNTTVA